MRIVLEYSGELDIATVPALLERLAPHRRPGNHVVLDLRRVVLMDCYSLGHILAAHIEATTEGWALGVLVETPAVRRLLDLTGADRFLPLELPAAGSASHPAQSGR